MQEERKIIFYKDDFINLYESLDLKSQGKIDFVLDIIRCEKLVPEKFFKHLKNTNGIYEIRISVYNGNIRILSFIDKGNLVIIMNCFYKKSRKTPLKEIRKAIKIKNMYLLEQK